MQKHLKVVQAALMTSGLLVAGTASAADAKTSEYKSQSKASEMMDEAKEDVSEATLNTKVRVSLLKSLKGADGLRVKINVQGSTVKLSGEVEDRASLKLAEESAKAVTGVTMVKNRIVHNPKAPHQANFESQVKDAVLASEVRLRLLQDVGDSALEMHITATDGVVSLRGQLPSDEARTRAVANIRDLSGVQRVEDLITVNK